MDSLFLATSNARSAIALEKLLERPAVRQLLETLNTGGDEARVIGGAVRDSLMGRPVGDIDIATTALPDIVTSRVNRQGWKAVPTGIEHGTVTVVIDGTPFEVTTLRRDISTDGRRATVAFTTDFAEDAQRRDFTINAMSLTTDGVIHDYGTGREDARTQVIRFMGDPGTRIREDYLRILRFFRFQASHGFGAPNAVALAACAQNKAGLAQLSRERIRQEMIKLLPAHGAIEAVAAMQDIGLWDNILLGQVIVPAQLQRLVVVEASLPASLAQTGTNPIRRLAALLEKGAADTSASVVSALTDQLRLSGREEAQLAAILNDAPSFETEPQTTVFARAYLAAGSNTAVDALLVNLARTSNLASSHQKKWLEVAGTILERKPVMPFRSINFDAHGIPHGPIRGDIIRRASEAWMKAGLPADKQQIKAILMEAMQG
jgi:poly(A) polymerase